MLFPTLVFVMIHIAASFAQTDMDIEDFKFDDKKKRFFFSRNALFSPVFFNMPSNVISPLHKNCGYETSLLFSRNKHTSAFNISTGLSFRLANFHSNVHTWLFLADPQSSDYLPQIYPEGFSYKKNKLTWYQLLIPIEFNFRFGKKEWEKYGFDLGAQMSLLLSSYNVFVIDLVKTKTIYKGQLNPFAFGIYGAFVYKKFSLMSELSLSPFFKSEDAVFVQFLTVGIAYSFYPPQFLL